MRYLALAIILLLQLGAAVAQPYQIQVKFTVRLRASYSLDSPVVGQAQAGDVMQVVGSFNRWLQIERGGETAWLADWVEYTRLNQEQTPPAEAATNQQRSNIDNCCFVNRQCHSDQEWVDGYWAYQRNECPAQPQSGSSSGTVAGHAIRIEGSPIFVSYISEALNLLRTRTQYWYNYVISGANAIVQDDSIFGGGLARGVVNH